MKVYQINKLWIYKWKHNINTQWFIKMVFEIFEDIFHWLLTIWIFSYFKLKQWEMT